MSKLDNFDAGKARVQLKIMNVIFALIAAFAITMYCIMPFLSVELGYVVKKETVEKFAGDKAADLDLSDAVGDGIEVNLAISITPKMLLKAATAKDGKKYVEEDIINYNIDKIIKDITPTLEKLVTSTIKSVAKSTLTNQLTDLVKDSFGSDSEAAAAIESLGLGEAVDNIMAKFEEGTPATEFVDTLLNELDNTLAALQDANPDVTGLDALGFTGETRDTIAENINGILSQVGLVDSDGNITSLESAMSNLMDMLGGGSEDSGSGEPAEAGEGDSDLSETIKNLIMDKIPGKAADSIATIMKFVAYGLGGLIVLWAYVFLMSFLKLFAKKKPTIFTGFIWGLIAFVQFFLGLVLTFGIDFVMAGKLPIAAVNNALKKLDGLSLHIGTSMMYAAFAVFAKWFMHMFYLPKKHKLKKAIKAERG